MTGFTRRTVLLAAAAAAVAGCGPQRSPSRPTLIDPDAGLGPEVIAGVTRPAAPWLTQPG